MTTVFFATNRVVSGIESDWRSYSAELQKPTDAGQMVYGTAFVSGLDVPRYLQGQVDSLQNINRGGFPADTQGDIAQAGRNLLVFVHGYDNSFSDALTRGAFNGAWLREPGLGTVLDTTVLSFSWPSLGDLVQFPGHDYRRDQMIADSSGFHLMSFLLSLRPLLQAARRDGRRAILLVHSMGHIALQSAVRNWFQHGLGDEVLFDLAVLAAGDCSAGAYDDPFPAGLSGLSRLASRTAIYYSGRDQVLAFSNTLNFFTQRLGQDGPHHRTDPALFSPDQFAMVDASGITDAPQDFLNSHQYYRRSPTIRADIASRLG